MVIRKEFRVESAHIVRNCTSERCSHSIHGHSVVIEVMLESDELDNAGMVYDFGLLKGTVKEFIDSTDHCYLVCNSDKGEFVKAITDNCDRYVRLNFNPSAEMLSMWYFVNIQKILDNTKTSNGEGKIKVKGIRYHETVTGWAECNEKDIQNLWHPIYDVYQFSEGCKKNWSQDLKDVMNGKIIKNPVVEQQITLNV